MNPSLKVGIISQARMTSTRLPGKILKTVKNKALLSYHTERLLQSGYPIFIATTTNETDSPLVDFCKDNKIDYTRGDEQNVLSRFYECASQFKLDCIVRVTSDCPLIDGKLIQEAVSNYINFSDSKLYYSNCIERTFPRGFDFEIFSFAMLKEAFENGDTDSQKEHVTPYFYQNIKNEFTLKHFKSTTDTSNYRITVDTQEDFDLIKILIEEFDCEAKSANQIIEVLKQNPSLVKINQHIEQKKA